MSLWVKICGITNDDDARAALEAGADAIGVNLVPSSRRVVDVATARRLRETVGARADVVAVVADLAVAELEELRERTGIRWLQLHGSESEAELARLLPDAYKALRVAEPRDLDGAAGYSGSRLLVDAKVPGELGGTGHTFDWSLVTRLAAERALILAGGLTPENVAAAVRFVRPRGVDTASGVESADPRRKDPEKVASFVRAARAALLGLVATALLGCSSSPPARELVAPDTPLPGVVTGLFGRQNCRDASGGSITLGPRLFVALAPPGLTEGARTLQQGTYPAGVITLLDQRAGHEGVLLSQGKREGDQLVYRSPLEARDGRTLLEEIRLPFDLSGPGEIVLADTQPGPGGNLDRSDHSRRVLLRCELVTLAPGLDKPEPVDYEPGQPARAAASPP